MICSINANRIIVLLVFCSFTPLCKSGYVFSHETESHSSKGLHFSHPLVSESPSPDTKVRLDYFFLGDIKEEHEGEEEIFSEHTIRLEEEYAFNRNVSLEVDVP